ncbi:MAG: type IV pilin [Methanolinea sp.]|nr:type IV pilin [Methanolinea sp.]
MKPVRGQSQGLNEVVASILMVVLVIALAIIIGGIVFGYITIQPKSAYIPPRVEMVDYAGKQAISLYSRGGDNAALDPALEGSYVLEIYLDTDQGTFKVIPDDSATTWNPGQTIYIYYNQSLSQYRTGYDVPQFVPDAFPAGNILLRVVDQRAKLLVFKEGIAVGGGGTGMPKPMGTPSCGTITGRLYNYQNNSGLTGWTVQYRSRKNQGDPWSQWTGTITGTGGTYTFSNLNYQPATFYEVGVVIQPGWNLQQPQSNYTFLLNPGQQCYSTGVDFGVQKS